MNVIITGSTGTGNAFWPVRWHKKPVRKAVVYGITNSPGFGGYVMFLLLLLIFVVIYLIILRPQQKREKKRKAMIEVVKRGDRVVTAGGIHGKDYQVDESSFLLDVDGGIKLRTAYAEMPQNCCPANVRQPWHPMLLLGASVAVLSLISATISSEPIIQG